MSMSFLKCGERKNGALQNGCELPHHGKDGTHGRHGVIFTQGEKMDDEALKKAQEFLEKSIEVKDYSDMSLNQLFKERLEILERMFLLTKELLEDTVNYQMATVELSQKMIDGLVNAVNVQDGEQ